MGQILMGTAVPPAGWAIPLGDLDQPDDGSRRPVYESYGFGTRNAAPGPALREINPTLTPNLNEEHAYPEYLKKFMEGEDYPKYYRQLLEVEPVDQIQSLVFDPKAFRKVRRIGVVHFENKTRGVERDPSAGNVLAEELSTELDSVGRYAVIRPKQMVEEYRLKIMTRPDKTVSQDQPVERGPGLSARAPAEVSSETSVYDLPYPADKIDAVMIGAVTRFSNTYYDQYGEPARSPAVAMEFAAYLISTRTGKAIWGARFVGSQKPSLSNVRFGKLRWLNKREYTRYVIQKVLKDFSDVDLETP